MGVTADRLVGLLGIPPSVVAYEQLTDEHLSRREWYDPPPPPIEPRTAPLIPLLLKSRREPVNSDLVPHVVPNVSKTLSADDKNRLMVLVGSFENNQKNRLESKFHLRDVVFLIDSNVVNNRGREDAAFHLDQVLSINDIIVLLFQVRSSTFVGFTQAVIVVGLSGNSPLVYTLSGEGNTAAALRLLQVDPSGPPHIALISIVGSSSVLTVTAFDPATRRVWNLVQRT
jgi:hypothetical protein